MSKTTDLATVDDDLCCCEYVNADGERTHILAFFCDCELIDDSFDRLFNKHERPLPPGRMNDILHTIFDRMRVPYFGGAKKLSIDIVAPIVILPLWMYWATWGPCWTIASIISLPFLIRMLGRSLRKRNNVKHFYYSFTVLGIIMWHLIFELEVMPQMKVTRKEYITSMLLITITIFTIYKTKTLVADIESCENETSTQSFPSYYYCRSCEKTIIKRDHHCVWLNCCIGVKNRYWFVGFLLICSAWISYTTYLSLTSICYPVYLFKGKDYGFFLIPLNCPDAYHQFGFCFVAAMYALCVAVFLMAIATHQMRMLYKGLSYLEWKYGSKSDTRKP